MQVYSNNFEALVTKKGEKPQYLLYGTYVSVYTVTMGTKSVSSTVSVSI